MRIYVVHFTAHPSTTHLGSRYQLHSMLGYKVAFNMLPVWDIRSTYNNDIKDTLNIHIVIINIVKALIYAS